jgi:hypothetical protein
MPRFSAKSTLQHKEEVVCCQVRSSAAVESVDPLSTTINSVSIAGLADTAASIDFRQAGKTLALLRVHTIIDIWGITSGQQGLVKLLKYALWV